MDRQDVGFEADFFAGKSVMELDGAGMLLIAENVADRTGVMRLRFPGFPLQGRLIRLLAPLEKSFKGPVADHALNGGAGEIGNAVHGVNRQRSFPHVGGPQAGKSFPRRSAVQNFDPLIPAQKGQGFPALLQHLTISFQLLVGEGDFFLQRV